MPRTAKPNRAPRRPGRSNTSRRRRRRVFRGGAVRMPVNRASSVLPGKQWNSPHTAAPPPVHNGGLYTGAPFAGPWGNIPVTQTDAHMIHNNLRSAEPPPGATKQYVTTRRLGNNYSATPGLEWYPGSKHNPGPFRMVTTGGGKKRGAKKTFKGKRGRRRTRSRARAKKRTTWRGGAPPKDETGMGGPGGHETWPVIPEEDSGAVDRRAQHISNVLGSNAQMQTEPSAQSPAYEIASPASVGRAQIAPAYESTPTANRAQERVETARQQSRRLPLCRRCNMGYTGDKSEHDSRCKPIDTPLEAFQYCPKCKTGYRGKHICASTAATL